jgi:SH3 domain
MLQRHVVPFMLDSQYSQKTVLLTYSDSSVATFSQLLASLVGNTTSAAQQLQCPSAEGAKAMRYQQSIQCSKEVQAAIAQGCTFDSKLAAKGPLLCQSSCTLASSTLTAYLSNTTACGSNNRNGDALVQQYTDYCITAAKLQPSNANQCTLGTNVEAQLCGWRDASIATFFCSQPSLKNDACCIKFLAGSGSSGLGTANIVIIVVVVIIAVALAAGGFLYFRRRKQQQDGEKDNIALSINPSVKAPEKQINIGAPFRPTTEKPAEQRASALFKTPSVEKTKSILKSPSKEFIQPKLDAPKQATLPRVNPSALPPGSKMLLVTHSYEATLTDELELELGDSIWLCKTFDDGWGLGYNPKTKQQGAFPMVCCVDKTDGKTETSDDDVRVSKRGSSMSAVSEALKILDTTVPGKGSKGLKAAAQREEKREKEKEVGKSRLSLFLKELEDADS